MAGVGGASHTAQHQLTVCTAQRPPLSPGPAGARSTLQHGGDQALPHRAQPHPRQLPLLPHRLPLHSHKVLAHHQDRLTRLISSPRSLAVCHQLELQPIDLLPNSLSEFLAAFPDLPRAEVVTIYRAEERERGELLERARAARRTLLGEAGQRDIKVPYNRL